MEATEPTADLAADGSESPTQVNEGRSYDRYELPSIQHLRRTPDESGSSVGGSVGVGPGGIGGIGDEADLLEPSLDENDTGAVNFDSLDSGGLDFDSPSAHDGGPWRAKHGLAAFYPNSDNDLDLDDGIDDKRGAGSAAARASLDAPETPAPPKNPFAGKFQTPLVDASQLFAQTPFSAANQRPASPTSSRPSPADFPAQAAAAAVDRALATTPLTAASSPLKPRFPASTSADGEQTPAPLFHTLSTSSQSRFEAITPYHPPAAPAEPPPSATVAEPSPTLDRRPRRRPPPAPIAEYEPMRQSQERRHAATAGEGRGASVHASADADILDRDMDADEASQQRRRIVRQKKEAATRNLAAIRVSRSVAATAVRDDVVEVPASTRKEQRSRSRDTQASRPTSSLAPEICPESDPPPVAMAKDVPASSAAPSVSGGRPPRSSLPESEAYEAVSFPQSLIDAYSASAAPVFPGTKSPSPAAAASLPALPVAEAGHQPRGSGRPPLHPRSSLNETEAIPETSPAGRRPTPSASARRPPALLHLASDASDAPPSRLASEATEQQPALSSSACVHDSKADPRSRRSPQGEHWDGDAADAAPSSPPVTATPPAVDAGLRRAKRARRSDEEWAAAGSRAVPPPLAAASPSSVGRSVSSLSMLSATPTQLSREGTPITANDSDRSTRGSDRIRRQKQEQQQQQRGPSRPARKSAASAASARRQPSFHLSGSTDELAASPTASPAARDPVHEQGHVPEGERERERALRTYNTRSRNREPSASLRTAARRWGSSGPGLFSGMAFAISVQAKRRGESETSLAEREKQAKALERRIHEAGGTILESGFSELFEPPRRTPGGGGGGGGSSASSFRLGARPLRSGSGAAVGERSTGGAAEAADELRLLPKAAGLGFVALVADGHSRKRKYMEALALGLPCLAMRWVTTCLDRHALVDWTPYVLCAGESSYLGGAIRSRSLAPYDAATARLADVVQRRAQLLHDVAILVLPPRAFAPPAPSAASLSSASASASAAPPSSRDVYIFLARVLGARLTHAHSLDDARAQLRAVDDAGRPLFDWVYTGEKTEPRGLLQDLLSDHGSLARSAASRASSSRARSGAPSGGGGGGAKKRKRSGSVDSVDRLAAPAVRTFSDERFIQSLILGKLIDEDDLGD